MKLIQVNGNKIVDILDVRSDITIENIRLYDRIPDCEYREGYNGVLAYSEEKGIYWEYVEIPPMEELTIEEKAAAYDILVGNNLIKSNDVKQIDTEEVNNEEGGEV